MYHGHDYLDFDARRVANAADDGRRPWWPDTTLVMGRAASQ
eukprot:SAG11_NODE_10091_length_856_cov_1.150594_1_plen_40_part_01